MYFFIYSATLVAWYEWSKQLEVSDVLFDAGFSSKKKLKALVFVQGIPLFHKQKRLKQPMAKILSVNHGITAMVVRWY